MRTRPPRPSPQRLQAPRRPERGGVRRPPTKSRSDEGQEVGRGISAGADPRDRRSARAGTCDPGLHRQALPDTQRLDASDAAHQPANPRRPDRQPLLLAARRRHHRLPPTEELRRGVRRSVRGQEQTGQDTPKPCGVAQGLPSSETFVKRVVGLPGDRISIVNGHVFRNGVAREGLLHRALQRARGVQLPGHDHRSRAATTT